MRIHIVLLLMVLPIVVPSQTQSRKMMINNTLGSQELAVVDARSPDFLSEVEKLLGPVNSSAGQSLLPFSLLLTNKTAKNIWGFTVIYTFPDKLAASGKPWTITTTVASWGPAEPKLMIAPGDTYLVTPVDDLSVLKKADGSIIAPADADEDFRRYLADFTTKFLTGTRVIVQLDSAIGEDGTMTGADKAGTMLRINGRIKAERDLIAATTGRSGADLLSYLDNAAKAEWHDEYSEHTTSRAGEFRDLVKGLGESGFRRQLEERRYGHWFQGNDFVIKKGDAR